MRVIKVNFLGPIKHESIELACKDFAELKAHLAKLDFMQPWLSCSALALNNKLLNTKDEPELKSGDVLSVLPPVCGG